MAEAKNSFIKSKMNKDLDDRLIPSSEYRDALNVAVSRSEGSDVGALEAILGNERAIENELVAGEEIIGVLVDDSNNQAFYFTTDFLPTTPSQKTALTNICTISRFNASSNTRTILVSGSFLNFSKDARMNGISLIEDLLFFSDNRNQPRKINVTNPLGYYVNEDQISVAKFAPYKAAEFINLRSTASLKPSTMTDASEPIQTQIGTGFYTTKNLDVSTYKNGETIPQRQSAVDWALADTNSEGAWCYYGNSLLLGTEYGKLYNRHAITDPRGLAPNGFTVMSSTDWNNIKDGVSPAERLKSSDPTYWFPDVGTNTTNFTALPGGGRAGVAPYSFQDLSEYGRWWTSDGLSTDANGTYIGMSENTQDVLIVTNTPVQPRTLNASGYPVRLKRDVTFNGWNGDPDYLVDRFVKFSYRFKFNDNEYSVIAPFSQDVFIPQQAGLFLVHNETQAFVTTVVEFMQNSINNAVLNIPLPSLDILNDFKIKGIDIVFKQSDMQAYQVLETVVIDDFFKQRLNNTNIFQYEYQSTTPIKTLTTVETSRVFDKVPVTARAQETAGNRIMYGNFVQGKSGQKGLDYYADVFDKDPQIFTEYPQHSLKQNRNYQVGIILADKFGRQTDIILSNYDNTLDANGQPQPGSNVFSDYNTIGFNSDVPDWTGDTLRLNFNSLIPETVNANNVSGYPGAYAVGDYYTIPLASELFDIFFRDYSTQTITATLGQVDFDFTGILWADTQVAANTYKVFSNTGTGWIELTSPTDYAVVDSAPPGNPVVTITSAIILKDLIGSITTNTGTGVDGTWTNVSYTTSGNGTGLRLDLTIAGNAVTVATVTNGGSGFLAGDTITIDDGAIVGTDVIITLLSTDIAGAPLGRVYKFELLYTAENYYKYVTGTTDNTEPLFPDFNARATTVFAVGQYLPGKYKDYTEIKSNVYTTGLDMQLFTKDEVDSKYLFDQTGTGRPEPVLQPADMPKSYATYTINVDGFYSYRVGIKQQQQDYYNVYLPGIVDGYPIMGSTKEQGETAFVTLVSDNINKIPRNLNEVGPLQNQFTSDISLFGRVTNTIKYIDTTPIAPLPDVIYRTTQFDPLTSSDNVDLVGTVKDAFPNSIAAVVSPPAYTTGEVNGDAIYDYDTLPYIAKISTQKAIGITQSNYSAPPAAGYDYPDNMGLAVYETSPYTSALELYYEATTTGLISDLNFDVQNVGTGINGISITEADFFESYQTETTITPDFFPLSGGLVDITNTAVLKSAYNYAFETNSLNSINYAVGDSMADGGNKRFELMPGAVAGSYYIRTVGTFYAGSSQDNVDAPGLDTQYSGHYIATIQFTAEDGTISEQTIDLQLVNSSPLSSSGTSPNPDGISPTELIVSLADSPRGYNGSAAVLGDAGVPAAGNRSIFDTATGGWSIQRVTRTTVTGVVTEFVGESASNILEVTRQEVIDGSLRFALNSVSGNGNTYGSSYVIYMNLMDTSGSFNINTIVVSYSVGSEIFSSVASSFYRSGVGYTSDSDTTMEHSTSWEISSISEFPRFIGQIQNWEPSTQVYLHARLKSVTVNSGFSVRIGNVDDAETYNTGNIGARLDGDTTGTAVLKSADRFTCPASATIAGEELWTGTIATLAPFTSNQTLINADVRPGQRNLIATGTLPTYDFSNSALVNFAISVEGGGLGNPDNLPPGTRVAMLPYLEGATVELFWSTDTTLAGTAPGTYTAIQLTMNAPALPFYPSTLGGVDYDVSATAVGTMAAQGPTNS